MKVFASNRRAGLLHKTRIGKPRASAASAVLLAAFSIFATQIAGAPLSLPLTGHLLGSVTDVAGTPQMGAVVQVFNKYDRPISKVVTSADGRFAFPALPIDVYSVRVSLASFLPASRDQIAIRAGLDSVLHIHLATLFSSIQVNYTVPDGAMTNDWKWVLRSSPATRLITRYLPLDTDQTPGVTSHPQIFSGTRAMLSLSGGDGGLIDTDASPGDFGTGFVLSTNILGKNQLQLGGSFGEAVNLGPAAMALCAIYSRNDDGAFGQPPEVTFSMSQIGTSASQFAALQNAGNSGGVGATVHSMSLSVYEVMDPFDSVHLEYGMTGESVDYLQHTSRISPFARITVTFGNAGQLVAAYSDGGRPDELKAHQQMASSDGQTDDADLNGAVNTLARVPQLSERNGNLELQRSQNIELGYRKIAGSRTFAVSAFHENVTNGRTNVAGDLSGINPGDLLYDGVSTTSTYNIGNYQRDGYIASVNQHVTQVLDIALAYGRMGGLVPNGSTSSADWSSTAKFLDSKSVNSASVNFDAHIPRAGTRLIANYGLANPDTLLPQHVFTTQNIYVEPGLNINIRQPLPSLFGLPGRLALTADLRNLLAQGYLPFDMGSGHTVLIVQSPRSLRGGLNFTF